MSIDQVSSLTRFAGFGISPGDSDAAKTAQDCVLETQLEGVSGGDRGGGVVPAVWDGIIFATEARRKAKEICRRFTQRCADENGEHLANGNWPKQNLFTAEARRSHGDLTAEDAKGAKAEKNR